MMFIQRYAVLAMVATFVAALAAGCSKRNTAAPLIDAACEGNVAGCEQLVKGGFPVDAADDEGVTALDWAISYCKVDVVRKLVELGADVNHVDQCGSRTPLMYTTSKLRGRFLRGTKDERNVIARILIQHGADVNHAIGDGHTIGDGQTTLYFAAKDENAELVRMLLSAGANRSAKDTHG